MQSLLSFIGGAGAVSLVGVLATWLEYEQGHSQHQKDITVKEIRTVRRKLKSLNQTLIKEANAGSDMRPAKLNLITYLASWSVNVVYHRVNVKMITYDLAPLFKLEYSMIKTQLNISNQDAYFADASRRVIKLFTACDIIK